MDYLNNFNSEFQLQTLLSEAKVILNNNDDLNEEKENLSKIIDRVNFLLGKHDELYNQFTELFIAMGQFDFSKRLLLNENGDTFVNFIANGVNMINEELHASAVNKRILYDLFKSLALENVFIVVTDSDGFISMANSGITHLKDFNDKSVRDQNVHALFTDFSVIENKIKDEGSIKNIEAAIKWKGEVFPVVVDVIICNTLGRIDDLIYTIRLLPKS